MHMLWEDQEPACLGHYVGAYRARGLLAKTQECELFIYDEGVQGYGYRVTEGSAEGWWGVFDFSMEEIAQATPCSVDGQEALQLICKQRSVAGVRQVTITLPGLVGCVEAARQLEATRQAARHEQRQRQEQEAEARRLAAEQQRQLEKDREAFLQQAVEFHLGKRPPTYILTQEEHKLAAMFLDELQGLHFVAVDASRMEERHGVIPYDQIHYYERAGAIHYVTEIQGQYASLGGSFTMGGWNWEEDYGFGNMGMEPGGVMGDALTSVVLPSTSGSLRSKATRVDDRNIILNYYSDAHRQFMDLELPSDSYNFLQTHLPGKKYDIVLEVEKQAAVRRQTETQGELQKPDEMPALETGAAACGMAQGDGGVPDAQKGEDTSVIGQAEAQGTGLDGAKQAVPEAPPAQRQGDCPAEPQSVQGGMARPQAADALADFALRVEKLRIMQQSGLLSQEEFEAQRQQLLEEI
jgi:hypothetical protein